MEVIQISAAFIGLVPVVIALVQIAKKYKYISARFIPLLAIVLSIGGVQLLSTGTAQEIIIQGILVGLSSIGLFSASRTTIQG